MGAWRTTSTHQTLIMPRIPSELMPCLRMAFDILQAMLAIKLFMQQCASVPHKLLVKRIHKWCETDEVCGSKADRQDPGPTHLHSDDCFDRAFWTTLRACLLTWRETRFDSVRLTEFAERCCPAEVSMHPSPSIPLDSCCTFRLHDRFTSQKGPAIPRVVPFCTASSYLCARTV